VTQETAIHHATLATNELVSEADVDAPIGGRAEGVAGVALSRNSDGKATGQDAAQVEAALLARLGQHGEMTGDDVARMATDDATGELGGEATGGDSGPANGVPGSTASVVFGRRPDRRNGGAA